MEEHNKTAIHIIADFYLCRNFRILNRANTLIKIAKKAVKKAKCKHLKTLCYKFKPQGISIIILLCESHLSIHTYPEYKYASIDIYTCGKKAKPESALKFLIECLAPYRIEKQIIIRGK